VTVWPAERKKEKRMKERRKKVAEARKRAENKGGD
jgi:hypothetical protein